MAYFAEINPTTKKVMRVIVADQAFIDSGLVGDSKKWLEVKEDGSLYGKYPKLGDIFHITKKQFFSERPETRPSFILDEQILEYKAPKPRPKVIMGMRAVWSEPKLDWEVIPMRVRLTPKQENEEIKRLIKAVQI